MSAALTLSVQEGDLAVVRLPAGAAVPGWVPADGFSSATRSAGDLSIVCAAAAVPADLGAPVERGWVRLELQGPFEFHLTGILASVLVPLAEAGVGIFALSTYDTDHVMVKDHQLDAAVAALRRAGHHVRT
jgi:hypothetical protein